MTHEDLCFDLTYVTLSITLSVLTLVNSPNQQIVQQRISSKAAIFFFVSVGLSEINKLLAAVSYLAHRHKSRIYQLM